VRERGPAARLALVACGVALVPFLLLVWRFDFLCDDAFITFRYARNLARGHGLVYNLGVEPPVEGYSEFLWALLLGGGMTLGLSPLILSRVLGIAAGLVVLFCTTRLLAERTARTGVATAGAALFLGSLPPLAVWTTGGMATMPFAAGVVGLFYLLWRGEEPASTWKLAVVASLVALLRADGAWWVAWILGSGIAIGLARGERLLLRRCLAAALISALVFGAHVGWRWITYGDWLPNTARVKLGLSGAALSRGSDYLVHFALTFPGVLLALLALIAARNWRARRVGPALLVVVASAAYAALVGGDFMAFGRFLVPALPFVALVLGAGLAALEERGPRVIAGALAALCLALSLLPAFDLAATPHAWRSAFSVRLNRPDACERSELAQWTRMNAQALEWRDLGQALAVVSEPGDSVVYGAVGAIGYYSDLFFYDRNGLVTREVALLPPRAGRSPGHDKTVPIEFFAKYEPTYLDVFWVPSRKELEENPVYGWGVRPLDILPLDPARSPRPRQWLVAQPGGG